MINKTTAVTAILIVFFTISSYSGELYPGAKGVKTDASDPQPRLWLGTLSNPSATKWLRITLPVDRKYHNATTIRGWVKVVDRSATENIFAIMQSAYKSSSGFYVWRSPYKYSAGISEGAQTLRFQALGGNAMAHTIIFCRIPPRKATGESRIVSYCVNEY